MFLYSFLLILILATISKSTQDDSINSDYLFGSLDLEELNKNLYLFDDEIPYWHEQNHVKLQVYYEALCPGSKDFVSTVLSPTVLELSQYLNIYLYPYGGAKTSEKDGHYEFQCQHGPLECYGNKLHACAIDVLQNITASVVFIGCMMDPTNELGSDDVTADQCGNRLKIDSTPIKECAKGDRGSILLKQYGDETKKKHLRYVPYKLINGKEYVQSDFKKEVCAAFVIPPPPCSTKSVELIENNEIKK